MATEAKLVPAQAGILANHRNAQKSTSHTGMEQGTMNQLTNQLFFPCPKVIFKKSPAKRLRNSKLKIQNYPLCLKALYVLIKHPREVYPLWRRSTVKPPRRAESSCTIVRRASAGAV